MIKLHPTASRFVLSMLLIAPLGVMGWLALSVLLPTLKNPSSSMFSSKIGYPSVQRLLGNSIGVETVSIAQEQRQDGIAAAGESVPLDEIQVRPVLTGPIQIEQVYVKEGQRVRKGQPLIQLQKAPYENAVSAARNQIAIAESKLIALQKELPTQVGGLSASVENANARSRIAQSKLDQINRLARQGAVSEFDRFNSEDIYASRQKELIEAQKLLAVTQNSLSAEVDDARLTLENAKIALQNALRDLNNTTLYATTDGLVSQLNIDSGEVAQGNPLPLVTLTENIVFQAFVDQARLNTVKVGDVAEVRLVAYPGRVFQGKVTQVNPTVTTNAARSGRARVGIDRRYTYSVWIQVDELQMPPGLQGYAQFVPEKSMASLPESAITHLSAGEAMVMVVENDQAVVRKIKVGRTFENRRQVLSGLSPQDRVILTPRGLNPGDRVQMNPANS
ncbi:HlyD family secretion protein [Leptolyngbya sp. NIES-2104]|uniref:HlyD family secretion protein n=1 Tax=Leptolyngbya sp. NIES-2104 TaxID=1552121 RepID=UPI0006EC82F1|nr:efflux RND transporter periplasmic adaptor subunit [Leptolyngbya sp. NIES-2104]GAP93823.1 probable Co/Zn/Cd efflux system membrane fusion protein [Leptolyngbya sp. NIES-2104]